MNQVWSLFSGAMGLDLGLEQAGIDATLAVEIDPGFCETIRANRPDLPLIQGDVSALTSADLQDASGWAGEVRNGAQLMVLCGGNVSGVQTSNGGGISTP
jgi:DNA (cytosine-5)-methyltransferase 1